MRRRPPPSSSPTPASAPLRCILIDDGRTYDLDPEDHNNAKELCQSVLRACLSEELSVKPEPIHYEWKEVLNQYCVKYDGMLGRVWVPIWDRSRTASLLKYGQTIDVYPSSEKTDGNLDDDDDPESNGRSTDPPLEPPHSRSHDDDSSLEEDSSTPTPTSISLINSDLVAIPATNSMTSTSPSRGSSLVRQSAFSFILPPTLDDGVSNSRSLRGTSYPTTTTTGHRAAHLTDAVSLGVDSHRFEDEEHDEEGEGDEWDDERRMDVDEEVEEDVPVDTRDERISPRRPPERIERSEGGERMTMRTEVELEVDDSDDEDGELKAIDETVKRDGDDNERHLRGDEEGIDDNHNEAEGDVYGEGFWADVQPFKMMYEDGQFLGFLRSDKCSNCENGNYLCTTSTSYGAIICHRCIKTKRKNCSHKTASATRIAQVSAGLAGSHRDLYQRIDLMEMEIELMKAKINSHHHHPGDDTITTPLRSRLTDLCDPSISKLSSHIASFRRGRRDLAKWSDHLCVISLQYVHPTPAPILIKAYTRRMREDARETGVVGEVIGRREGGEEESASSSQPMVTIPTKSSKSTSHSRTNSHSVIPPTGRSKRRPVSGLPSGGGASRGHTNGKRKQSQHPDATATTASTTSKRAREG